MVNAARAALLPAAGVEPVGVIVHDDGSTDGTQAALEAFAAEQASAGARLHVVRSESNGGYGRSLLRLLRAATPLTDAVILCADDDLPLPEGAPAALQALAGHHADMLSTPVPRDGRPGLDRDPPRDRAATAPELRAVAAHAPGIVVRTASLDGALGLLERRLDLGCAFARAYPQAGIAAHLLANGRVRWGRTPVVATGLDLPTGIFGAQGGTYSDPVERWRQWIAFQELLDTEIDGARGASRTRWHAIRAAEGVQLLPHLRDGLAERPEHALRFDRAGARTYRDGRLVRPVRWLRSLLRAPERAYLMARAGDVIGRRARGAAYRR